MTASPYRSAAALRSRPGAIPTGKAAGWRCPRCRRPWRSWRASRPAETRPAGLSSGLAGPLDRSRAAGARDDQHRPGARGSPYRERGAHPTGGGSGMTTSFDPLATSDLIVESYRRYLKSLLPVRDPGIAAALEDEISRSRLTKGPLLESAPPYAHGATLADLVAEGVLDPAFPGWQARRCRWTGRCTCTRSRPSARSPPGATSSWLPGPGRARPRASCCRSLTRCPRSRPLARWARRARPAAVSHERAGQRPDQAAQARSLRRPAHHVRPLRRGTRRAQPERQPRHSPC